MKKIIIISTLIAVFSTGCLTCKKAIKFQATMDSIDSKISEAINQPSTNLVANCEYMKSQGSGLIQDGAVMAERAAYSKFFYTDSRCTASYHRTVCDPY